MGSVLDGQDQPRQARHHRFRGGGLYGRDLCRPRHAAADPDSGHPARWPAHHHHRCRELSRFRRRHPGPLADGADAEAGRACGDQARQRPREQGRSQPPAVPARMRVRRPLPRRQRDRRDRRPGALAGVAVRAEIQGLRRFRLRHLRRLLLSRQGRAGDRRRQYRGRGGAVSHQFRFQHHGRAPARPFPRGEDPAGSTVQESENFGDLGHGAGGGGGRGEPAQSQASHLAQRQNRRPERADGGRRIHRHRPHPRVRVVRWAARHEAFGLHQDRAVLDRDLGARRVRRRRRHRRRLSPGSDRRRPRLHGSARSRTLPRPARRGGAGPCGGVKPLPSTQMTMDWDKLKVFHAAAEAGSFTHAGEQLGLSQSAVSRQVSALEQELTVALFHRHARGLILTEQGELLYRTAHEVFMKLESARAKLTDSRERPNGDLKITTTVGIGVHWLTPRLGEFGELYPDIRITLITTDEELDLAMREADVAIRLRQPTQPDLIQRKLFSVRVHAFASPEYLKRFGTPHSHEDLDKHHLLVLGGNVPQYLQNTRWLVEVARNGKGPRSPHLIINNIIGILRACQAGLGIAMLPDYIVEEDGGLVQLFGDTEAIALDAYFVYPEELKSVARVQAFRDFLVSKAQRWNY